MFFSSFKAITFIESPNIVYCVFNFEIYSSVIKKAIDVIKAEPLAIGIPILGLTIDNVEDRIVSLISLILRDVQY